MSIDFGWEHVNRSFGIFDSGRETDEMNVPLKSSANLGHFAFLDTCLSAYCLFHGAAQGFPVRGSVRRLIGC